MWVRVRGLDLRVLRLLGFRIIRVCSHCCSQAGATDLDQYYTGRQKTSKYYTDVARLVCFRALAICCMAFLDAPWAILWGSTTGAIKRDTRSLDYSSYNPYITLHRAVSMKIPCSFPFDLHSWGIYTPPDQLRGDTYRIPLNQKSLPTASVRCSLSSTSVPHEATIKN